MILLLFACVFSASSCSGHKWGGGCTSLVGDNQGESFNYVIEHLTFDDRLYFVLVADGCSGASSITGAESEGQLRTVDGREVSWSCATEDGAQAAVAIGGQEFQLTRGAVFLVTAKDNKTSVQQLSTDIADLPRAPVNAMLRTLGSREPQIAAFLKGVPDLLTDGDE